jgi:hypothetical protein
MGIDVDKTGEEMTMRFSALTRNSQITHRLSKKYLLQLNFRNQINFQCIFKFDGLRKEVANVYSDCSSDLKRKRFEEQMHGCQEMTDN